MATSGDGSVGGQVPDRLASVDDLAPLARVRDPVPDRRLPTESLGAAKKGLKGSPSWRLCIGKHDSGHLRAYFHVYHRPSRLLSTH
jgi:hypothetical protein